MPYPDFLRGLLQEELILRPELNRQLFLRYLDDRFVTQGRSLCLIGPPGVGNRRQRAPKSAKRTGVRSANSRGVVCGV
jgi:hypothetical protein